MQSAALRSSSLTGQKLVATNAAVHRHSLVAPSRLALKVECRSIEAGTLFVHNIIARMMNGAFWNRLMVVDRVSRATATSVSPRATPSRNCESSQSFAHDKHSKKCGILQC